MSNKSILNILKETNEIEDATQRASFLRLHMRPTIKKILACFHNPAIEFEKFDVKYSSRYNLPGISDSSVENEAKRLYIFEKKFVMDKKRKDLRLTQILEGFYKDEAELLYDYMLKKINPYKNINKVFIRNNFPEILIETLTMRK